MKPHLLCTPKSIYGPEPLPVVFLFDYPFSQLKYRLCIRRPLRTNQGKNYSPNDFLPMPEEDNAFIYTLSPKEGYDRLLARLREFKKKILGMGKGIPITYRDERCPTDEYFIQEYEDGTTYLAFYEITKKEILLICRIDD
ncbi:MAG TPA: hypothetical protein VHD83_04200 [Puia sp.]|nr:hypothetical protein [Puia sp.]